jgi:hypothetical protein
MLLVDIMNCSVYCENFKDIAEMLRTGGYLHSLLRKVTNNYNKNTEFTLSHLLYLPTNVFKQGRTTENL